MADEKTGGITSTGRSTGNTSSNSTNGKQRTGRIPKPTGKVTNDEDLGKNLVEKPKQDIPTKPSISIPLPEKPVEEKRVVQAKPKTTSKKRTTNKSKQQNVTDIQNLLQGIFAVVSLKAGPHWALSDEEANSIASPLSNIMERYEMLEKASELSDPIALVVATATIAIPRIAISRMETKDKKAKVLKNNGAIAERGNNEKRNTTPNNGQASGRNVEAVTHYDGEFIKSLSNDIQESVY